MQLSAPTCPFLHLWKREISHSKCQMLLVPLCFNDWSGGGWPKGLIHRFHLHFVLRSKGVGELDLTLEEFRGPSNTLTKIGLKESRPMSTSTGRPYYVARFYRHFFILRLYTSIDSDEVAILWWQSWESLSNWSVGGFVSSERPRVRCMFKLKAWELCMPSCIWEQPWAIILRVFFRACAFTVRPSLIEES